MDAWASGFVKGDVQFLVAVELRGRPRHRGSPVGLGSFASKDFVPSAPFVGLGFRNRTFSIENGFTPSCDTTLPSGMGSPRMGDGFGRRLRLLRMVTDPNGVRSLAALGEPTEPRLAKSLAPT